MLGSQNRFDEAFAEMEHARALEPTSPSYYSVRGWLHMHAGQHAESQEAYCQALRLSIDFESAIRDLMFGCAAWPNASRRSASLRRN